MFHFASCQPKPQIPGRQQRSFASVDRGHLYSPLGLKGLLRIYWSILVGEQLYGTSKMDPLCLSRFRATFWTPPACLAGEWDTENHNLSDISHPSEPLPSPWRSLQLKGPRYHWVGQNHQLGCRCSCHRGPTVRLCKRMAFPLWPWRRCHRSPPNQSQSAEWWRGHSDKLAPSRRPVGEGDSLWYHPAVSGERERERRQSSERCGLQYCKILFISMLFSTFRITLRIWKWNGGRALTEVKHGKYLTVRSQKNEQN